MFLIKNVRGFINKQILKNHIIFLDMLMNLDNRQLKSEKHVLQKVVKK